MLKLDKEPFTTKKDLVKKFLMQVGEPVEPVVGNRRRRSTVQGTQKASTQWDGHMETGGPKERGRWK